jgi:hypothetical protein
VQTGVGSPPKEGNCEGCVWSYCAGNTFMKYTQHTPTQLGLLCSPAGRWITCAAWLSRLQM